MFFCRKHILVCRFAGETFIAIDGNPWITMNYHEIKTQHFRWTTFYLETRHFGWVLGDLDGFGWDGQPLKDLQQKSRMPIGRIGIFLHGNYKKT